MTIVMAEEVLPGISETINVLELVRSDNDIILTVDKIATLYIEEVRVSKGQVLFES